MMEQVLNEKLGNIYLTQKIMKEVNNIHKIEHKKKFENVMKEMKNKHQIYITEYLNEFMEEFVEEEREEGEELSTTQLKRMTGHTEDIIASAINAPNWRDIIHPDFTRSVYHYEKMKKIYGNIITWSRTILY